MCDWSCWAIDDLARTVGNAALLAKYPAMMRRALTQGAWFATVLAGQLLAADVTAVQPTDSPEVALVRQLQQRQLHRLAELHCRRQLERVGQAGDNVVPWVLGLLDALAGRALSADDLTDAALWSEADRLAADYQQRLAGTEQGVAIALRRYLVQLARANSWLLAAAFDADPEPRHGQARELLRQIARSLKELDDEVSQILRSAPVRDDADQSRALQALQQQIQFAAATVFLRHADAYSDRSPDRVHLLTKALRSFTELARRVPLSELTLESRLREIECLRRLHSFEVARQRLAQFPTDDLSPAIQQQLALQQARLEMDQGNLQQAVQKLLAAQQSNENVDPERRGELLLALVEAYLELAKQDGSSLESAESHQWHNLALDCVRQMDDQTSTYWVRRAEAMLALQPTDAAGMTELEIMSRTADNFYRRAQHEEALAAYQRAAQLAHELDLPSRQFTFSLRAAAVQQQLRRHGPASEAFRQLANRFPQHEQAAQAHWLAIASEAELVRRDPSRSTAYRQLLEEHLQTWPQSQWADEARYWLGRLLLRQDDIDGARRYWLAIDGTSERFDQAMRELRRHYHERLNELADQPEDQQHVAQEAIAIFRQWDEVGRSVVRGDGQPAGDAVLSIAEIGLLHYNMSPQEAQRLLDAAHDEQTKVESYIRRIQVLQGLAQALSGKIAEAERLWEPIEWREYELALPLARRVHVTLRAAAQTSGAHTELARLQQQLTEQLLRIDTWKGQPQLIMWNAVALASSGERAAAIERLERLAADSPPDAMLELLLAELYDAAEAEAEQQRAIDHWRRLVRLSPARSERWFRGKLGIARGLAATGQRQRAAEMIALLQTLHPELGGPSLKPRFLALQSELQNSP